MFVDTSLCIDLLREWNSSTKGPATAKLADLADVELRLPIFVLCELEAGARISADPRRELRRVADLVTAFTVVHTDDALPAVYGELEIALRRAGTPIPPMDLLIGSAAVRHDLPLLTRDLRHYGLIPGLVVETY